MKRLFAFMAALSMSGCGGCGGDLDTGSTTKTEMEQTESNHRKLVASTPPPQFDHSLERENLVRRLKALNVQNKTSYIYLLSLDGSVVANYVVKGKVSSLNSALTTPEQVVAIPRRTGNERTYHVLPSPDFDGSYGNNPEGIFFFTADDTYVEWSGTYLLADKPLKITSPVKLQANIDLEKKGG